MKRLLVLVLVCSIASPAAAGEFLELAAGIVALHASPSPQPSPTPNPPVKPSSVCDNCDGVGKLGDGTVFVVCPVCKGSGKKTTSPGGAQAVVPRLPNGQAPVDPPSVRASTPSKALAGDCASGQCSTSTRSSSGRPSSSGPFRRLLGR